MSTHRGLTAVMANPDPVLNKLIRKAVFPEEDRSTDGHLLHRFVTSRDELAFQTLVNRHGSMVFSVCRRILVNHDDAQDAFQATFLILIRKADEHFNRLILGDWLHGVARRVALKSRSLSSLRRLKEQKAARSNLAPDVKHPNDYQAIDEEISKLPEIYRLPVVLCDLQGLTRREAAQNLNWLEGTVAGRLARARALLAKRLRNRHCFLALSTVALTGVSAEAAPASLMTSTVKLAIALQQGKPFAELVSENVYALYLGGLNAMWMIRAKVITAVLITLCLVGAAIGIGIAEYQQHALPQKVPVSDEKKALEKWQGKWKLETIEYGKTRAKMFNCEWSVASSHLKMNWELFSGFGTSVTLNPDVKDAGRPSQGLPIDLLLGQVKPGDKEEEASKQLKTVKAIYEIQGDTLKVAWRSIFGQNRERPDQFKVDEDDNQGVWIMTFSRSR